MDKDKNVEYLKARTSCDNEDLLKTFIEDAEAEIKGYINAEEIPEQLGYIVRKLSLWFYNRQGIEGIKSFSEAGTSQSIQELNENDLTALQYYRSFEVGGYDVEE